VVDMIITDLLPIHLVKKKKYFSPNYKIPSEKKLRDMMILDEGNP